MRLAFTTTAPFLDGDVPVRGFGTGLRARLELVRAPSEPEVRPTERSRPS
jgi:hypothetical protein